METVGGWEERAACRGVDPALFFPERGETAAAAKAVCATCVVRSSCLAEHLHEPDGIWGGTTPMQRRRMRVELNAERATSAGGRASCGTEGGYVAHRRRKEPPCAACREGHRVYEAGRRARQGAA